MKKTILINVVISFTLMLGLFGQEETSTFKKEFSGRIWYQYYYDTYKSVETRDGILLLYPGPLDDRKINENGKLGSSAFFSRFSMKFSGSEAFGAKASGMIEGDFFATGQEYVGHLRLRHAFVKLDWEKSSLLFGQYWHTMVSTDVMPSANLIANVPFFPLNRNPMIDFSYQLTGEIRASVAAIVHASHRSRGPGMMQRNSGIPEFAGKIRYKTDNLVLGINGGIKTLKPRLETEAGEKTTKMISTPYAGLFVKIKTTPVTFKSQLIYGQNLTHFIMVGGMGVKDTTRTDFDYSALKTLAAWADVHTNGSRVQFGLFLGYTQLMGATDNYISLPVRPTLNDAAVALHRAENMDNTMRIAPRVDFFAKRMKIGVEYVLDKSVYGSQFDTKNKVEETLDPVYNNRFLLNVQYDF